MCSFCIREISNKPSIIYLVCSDSEGKYYKISTGRKILYSQWNKRKQEPIISSMFSNDVNRSALVTCHILNKLKSEYQNYIYYLCSNNEKFNINILRAKINSIVTNSKLSEQIINFKVTDKMVKGNIGKTPSATKALDKALKQYIADSQVKESTGKNYKLLVGKYKRWIVDVYKVDSMSALKQSAFDKYVEYLKKEGASSNEINKLVVIKKLINNYIAKGNKYGLTQIIFNPLKDKRLSDDKVKVELLDNEIEKLETITLPAEYQLYRDLFMLAIYTGQRVSDIQNIAVGEYNKKDGYLIVRTVKRDKNAYIPYTEKVQYYLKRVEGKVRSMSGVNFRNKLNNNIKEIFRLAEIDREVTYIDAHQKTITAPLYSIISSHFARHTFTTKKVREGYSFEEVGKMIGDTGRVIEKTYSHLTADDHINTLHKAQERIVSSKFQVKSKNERQVSKEESNVRQSYEPRQSSKLREQRNVSSTILSKNETIETLTSFQQAIGYIENNSKEPQRVIEYLRQNNISINQLIRYYSQTIGHRKEGMVFDLDSTMEFLVSLKGKI